MTLETKYCKKCDRNHPVEGFSKKSSSKDGLHPYCRDCDRRIRKERSHTYRSVNENLSSEEIYGRTEKATCSSCCVLQSSTNFHVNTTKKNGLSSICKSCRSEYFSAYYTQHSERIKERVTLWQESNADLVAGYKRKWAQENPEAVIKKSQTRRARESNQHIEAIDIGALRDRDGVNCCYCGVNLTFTKRNRTEYIPTNAEHEHIVAIDAGGLNSYENSTLICARCNRSKKSKTVFEFINYREARGLPIKLNAHVLSYMHELTHSKEESCTSDSEA